MRPGQAKLNNGLKKPNLHRTIALIRPGPIALRTGLPISSYTLPIMSDTRPSTRYDTWHEATGREWDTVVIGGGVTGAGIAREAAWLGFSVLLVEQKDFAWGTSSRSSKMIHGGLRYLKERQIQLTREAVRERERLLRDGAGLVEPLRFIYLVYKGDQPGSWTLDFGLTVYDLLKRGGRNHHHLNTHDLSLLAPNLNLDGLRGAFGYTDAQTDDARLVFRVLREAELHGARTLNYARATELIRDESGAVRALAVEDVEKGSVAEIRTRSVISAAGVWSGDLAASSEDPIHIRPLRGSHLVLSWEKLPAAQSITFAHPEDGRPVFAYPWEGVTLVGTTDLDHEEPLDNEPAATPGEKDYLLEAIRGRFKDLSVSDEDLIGSFAGVRPVVFGGHDDPSQEPREYVIREEKNFITVAGGKLTTFHPISRRVTLALQTVLGVKRSGETSPPSLEPLQPRALEDAREVLSSLPHLRRRRLTGRLGPDLAGFLEWVYAGDLEEIPETPYTWAELKWAFGREPIVHLDDLLLRRARLGHLLPQGGLTLKTEIQDRLQPEGDWSPERWENEWARYRTLWETCYSPTPIRRS